MSGSLCIWNRQRTVRVNTRHLRRLTRTLLRDLFKTSNFDLGIYLIRATEMARLNETFLRHKGPTDVITFDYKVDVTASSGRPLRGNGARRNRLAAALQTLHGEIFICPEQAVTQARRFHTRWQSELGRYVIHALLHLNGFDDLRPGARRQMKRAEDGLLRALARRVNLSELAKHRPAARRAFPNRPAADRKS